MKTLLNSVIRLRRITTLMFALSAFMFATQLSEATDVLYATGNGTGSGAGLSALYSIDPNTGAATLLWNFASIHIYGGGLAYDAASDSLFATGANINSEETLYRINRFTGTATAVGPMGTNVAFSQGGASIDPTTGILYASTLNGGQNTGLYTVNKVTGTPTLVGQASGQFTIVYGLGFRSDGTLFGNGRNAEAGSKLFAVDKSSGATSLIGPHGVGVGRQLAYSGLAFRSDGAMLSLGSLSASQSGLYSVNPTTGAATVIGNTGIQFGVDGGLAFAPGAPVPEPGTMALLSLGLATILRKRTNLLRS